MSGSFVRPLRRTFIFPLLAAALAGCGGGLYIGIGDGDFDGYDDRPPTVSLTVPVTSIQAGQPLALIASASDENGIDDVIFYRVDGGTFTALGSDGSSPYELTTTAPTDGRTTLTVMARARDNAGNSTDSALVSVTVTP
jgi:Bacterial Ig domain